MTERPNDKILDLETGDGKPSSDQPLLVSPACPRCKTGKLTLLSTSRDSSDWLTPGEPLKRRMIYVYKCECGRAFTHVIFQYAGGE
jgi:hypothetical protein